MDLSRPAAGVLFVAPECAPLTKTGGLGDVCAALPAALRELGFDVRVLMPGYPEVLRIAGRSIASLRLPGAESPIVVSLREAELPSGVPLLVLDAPELYVRDGGPYLSPEGVDWPDNPLRFGALSRAAARLAGSDSPLAGIDGWRPALVHCNDWPCGLAPAYLRYDRSSAASLMTVHNLAFQGLFEPGWVQRLRLPAESYSPEGLEFHGRMSFLKAGLAYAQLISTVSPGYAREIRTPEYGCGLDGLLRHRGASLHGILNGIDTRTWNPATDLHLAAAYDRDSLERKAPNKAALQRRLGLVEEPGTPLLGLVGRLTAQKGLGLVLQAAPALAAAGQLAILGSGERELEAELRALAARYPGRIGVHVGFDEGLAHLVEAGADVFLMPSRYEPCGLNQMYSQRYGTPPVVHATGGLADTVEDGVTGFAFRDFTAGAFLEATGRALRCHADPAAWREVQRAGMARDFSWSAAALRYADLYRRLAAPAPA